MSDSGSSSSVSHTLAAKTPFLSLKLYVVIAIVSLLLLGAFLLVLLCVRSSRISRKRKMRVKHSSGSIPLVSKEIAEIKAAEKVPPGCADFAAAAEKKPGEVRLDVGSRSDASSSEAAAQQSNIGWGRWYGLRELEIATRGFSETNVIGEGGYGIVYRGCLSDGSVVAVKNLLNNK